jgi:HSP20 family protein
MQRQNIGLRPVIVLDARGDEAMAAKGKRENKGKEVDKGKEVEKAAPAPGRATTPFEDIDRLLESLSLRGWMRPMRMDWPGWGELQLPLEARMPRVDVVDREAEVVVRAELPGVDKKDLQVSATDNTVTIKGSSRHEEKEEKGDFYRCEISRGSFSRSVVLPAVVDGTKGSASFKDGVLELVLPKAEKAKRRNINVK